MLWRLLDRSDVHAAILWPCLMLTPSVQDVARRGLAETIVCRRRTVVSHTEKQDSDEDNFSEHTSPSRHMEEESEVSGSLSDWNQMSVFRIVTRRSAMNRII